MLYYQDDHLYYFRKPAGIPSTFWKEHSFLDTLLTPLLKGGGPDLGMPDSAATGGSIDDIPFNIIASLHAFFWKEGELWLLNRLDNETSGLLYFAKNPRVYKQFKEMQSASLLNKYYIAEVYGNIQDFFQHHPHSIIHPIMHHKYNADRMVVIQQNSDKNKAKWREHHLVTEIIEFQFLPTSNTSILLLRIHKGIRHQIRAHLSAIGYPICGDKLYSKSDHKNYDTLQLFSVGLETK